MLDANSVSLYRVVAVAVAVVAMVAYHLWLHQYMWKLVG